MNREPYRGLRSDQSFIPGMAFGDDCDRILSDDLGWCKVSEDGRWLEQIVDEGNDSQIGRVGGE